MLGDGFFDTFFYKNLPENIISNDGMMCIVYRPGATRESCARYFVYNYTSDAIVFEKILHRTRVASIYLYTLFLLQEFTEFTERCDIWDTSVHTDS